jgi:lipoate-protein ligase B
LNQYCEPKEVLENTVEIFHLGLQSYGDTLELMRKKHELISKYPTEKECILLVQHPNVVTVGNRPSVVSDVVSTQQQLQNFNVEYFEVERGGSATVHEPGQIVMYPLLRCSPKLLSVKTLVWSLEEGMIRVCEFFGVTAERNEINPGIWVQNNKIGALGLRVKDRVSFHGCALNVCNSLETFSHIVPCGLRNKGVTSIQKETGVTSRAFRLNEIEELLVMHFLKCLQ